MRYKLSYKFKNTDQFTPMILNLETDDFCELVDKWNHILQEFQMNKDNKMMVCLEVLE